MLVLKLPEQENKEGALRLLQHRFKNWLNSLINLLPSLRIGEAVVVGEAINIPSRVKLPLQDPRPDSSDPEVVKAWSKDYVASTDQYATVVTNIREQKIRRLQHG